MARWSEREPSWGEWGVPESQLELLPSDVAGRDVIELGCGTGYISAWLARRGARPVGIDNSQAQLQTARRLQREFGLEFSLIHGNPEDVPAPDASFDLAISEYRSEHLVRPVPLDPRGRMARTRAVLGHERGTQRTPGASSAVHTPRSTWCSPIAGRRHR